MLLVLWIILWIWLVHQILGLVLLVGQITAVELTVDVILVGYCDALLVLGCDMVLDSICSWKFMIVDAWKSSATNSEDAILLGEGAC